jgi:hypothetical protein
MPIGQTLKSKPAQMIFLLDPHSKFYNHTFDWHKMVSGSTSTSGIPTTADYFPWSFTVFDNTQTIATTNSPISLNIVSNTPVFDVDPLSGFMPPHPPLMRLPTTWEPWELLLDDAVAANPQVGDKLDVTDEDIARVERWRLRVRQVSSFAMLFRL